MISLVPSATETLMAWGVVPIACTRFCERPELEHVGGTKNPNIDRIMELVPDLVVMDREENRIDHYRELSEAGLPIEVLHIDSLDDVAPELGRLAERLGVKVAPQDLGPPDLEANTQSIGLRAFVPIWRRPWMTIGANTYATSLLNRLGVTVAFSDRPEPYPQLSDEDISAPGLKNERVDVVLVPTEPYSFSGVHVEQLGQLAPAYVMDGQDLFWWGARTPRAVRNIANQLGEICAELQANSSRGGAD